MPRWIKIWAGFVALGFLLVFAGYGAKPQVDSAVRDRPVDQSAKRSDPADHVRLADQLVNRLTALDNRLLAVCHLDTGCANKHEAIIATITAIQRAKRYGADAELRRFDIDELEAKAIPLLESYERLRESQERLKASKDRLKAATENTCRILGLCS